jgi:hypothetical protein
MERSVNSFPDAMTILLDLKEDIAKTRESVLRLELRITKDLDILYDRISDLEESAKEKAQLQEKGVSVISHILSQTLLPLVASLLTAMTVTALAQKPDAKRTGNFPRNTNPTPQIAKPSNGIPPSEPRLELPAHSSRESVFINL